MDYRLISFFCPLDLLERVDRLAVATHCSRTVFFVEAARVLAREIGARGGYLVPPYSENPVHEFTKRQQRCMTGKKRGHGGV